MQTHSTFLSQGFRSFPALMNVIIGQRSSVEIISAHAYYNFALKLPFQTTRARSEGLLKVGKKALLSTSRRV